jgi:hypothetical protein
MPRLRLASVIAGIAVSMAGCGALPDQRGSLLRPCRFGGRRQGAGGLCSTGCALGQGLARAFNSVRGSAPIIKNDRASSAKICRKHNEYTVIWYPR